MKATFHARQRSVERFGKDLSDAECVHIRAEILSKRAVFRYKEGNRKRVYFVRLRSGRSSTVVWDRVDKKVVTIW